MVKSSKTVFYLHNKKFMEKLIPLKGSEFEKEKRVRTPRKIEFDSRVFDKPIN